MYLTNIKKVSIMENPEAPPAISTSLLTKGKLQYLLQEAPENFLTKKSARKVMDKLLVGGKGRCRCEGRSDKEVSVYNYHIIIL